ncbi:E3 ubiquitin-protein ligase TTC3 isoform X2 [Lepisosteus oculatus]|uniref:E3 ubiquitin-protein ligase TTC3 isoform X2 n=1 Tax=Lepisosteus oculatus TaxID=7918 RepID=UPI003711896C
MAWYTSETESLYPGFSKMCDVDSDPEFEDAPHARKRSYENIYTLSPMSSLDRICDSWRRIPPSVKTETCQVIHVYVFWWHILLKQSETSSVTRWAVEAGFLDANIHNDLTLKRLYRIEILESVLRATARGCLRDDLAMELMIISYRFNGSADWVDEAIHWLQRTGEPEIASIVMKLGSKKLRFLVLSFVFTEYAQNIEAMAIKKADVISEFKNSACACCIRKSEEMKKKGNDQFQKRKYDAAVKWYTKAIRFHPENHILYGNRALCFFRGDKYQKAIGDGKRATLLQPSWAKGHYRFCDALFFLGERVRALEANEKAQVLCSNDSEGMRDLLQQSARFREELDSIRGAGRRKKNGAKSDFSRKPEADTRTETESQRAADEDSSKPEPESKSQVVEHQSTTGVSAGKVKEEGLSEYKSNETRETIREMPGIKKQKIDAHTPDKQKMKGKNQHPQEKLLSELAYRGIQDKLRSLVQDAHTAMADQRWRNAQQAFSQALCLLDSTMLKDLSLSSLDHVILIYGHAAALQEIGQPEELAEAEAELYRIESDFKDVRRFHCVVYYGIGKVYLRQNRFSEALAKFNDSLIMIKHQITPGKQTWPTTTVIVKETQTDYLKDVLEKAIEVCKFPPKPDAVCCCQQCLSHSKIQIYFTDPDFKGFIRMMCCQMCSVEYHINCWKKMKAVLYNEKNDKDFLQDTCFTPDCGGKISRIIIYGSNGLIKCEFESSVQKSRVSGKSVIKQKCTSQRKMKSKEDRKFRRKQQRKAASEAIKENLEDSPVKSDGSEQESQSKAPQKRMMIGDCILQQISENKQLLEEEKSLDVLVEHIRPWIAIEREKGNIISAHGLEEPETLGDIVDLLLETKNRVWARVFIEALTQSPGISPKQHDWAHRLNNAGLKAAKDFLDQYSEYLEELDLSPLLSFPPLQDVLIQKFGTMPEFFSSPGFTITDYFKQAPPEEMRLFIWTLEQNREQFPSFQHALDEYFDIKDGICVVIKKSENENLSNCAIKPKNRNRKKKHKESPKTVYVLSGIRSGVYREEEDEEDIFTEADTLMLFDSYDPFIIPTHLRSQVEEFEGHYDYQPGSSFYRRALDNNPDPTRESLYDYFAQVLEEHGPMEADNPLLVGEFENFPPEAQRKIEEAGGLKSFLLGSLRFVLVDNLIGLMKHAVCLRGAGPADEQPPARNEWCVDLQKRDREGHSQKKAQLNPAAKEFKPIYCLNADMTVSSETPLLSDHEHLPDGTLPLIQTNHYSYSGLTPAPVYSAPESTVFSDQSDLFVPYIPPHVHCEIAPNSDVIIAGPLNSSIGIERSNRVFDPERTKASETIAEYSAPYHSPPNDALSHQYVFNSDINNEGIQPHHVKLELRCPMKTTEDTKTVLKKSVYVQVLWEPMDDVAVNTEPYKPFEKNKGDLILKEKDNIDLEKQLKQIEKGIEENQRMKKEEITSLEEELKEINQNIEIANKELELFQQKLEEEVKKDQQEKKENQETLKALKNQIKELTESNEICLKNIKEKKKEYNKHLNDFLDLSNQSAAEKMSLEEVIKKSKDMHAEAVKRSQAAEICLLENKCKASLRNLQKCVSEGESVLAKLKQIAAVVPPPAFFIPVMDAWQAHVLDAKEKIRKIEGQYKEQIELVKMGTWLTSLAPVNVPSPLPAPVLPALPAGPVISDPAVLQVLHSAPRTSPPIPQFSHGAVPFGLPVPGKVYQRSSSPAKAATGPALAEPHSGKPRGQTSAAGAGRSPSVSPALANKSNTTNTRPAPSQSGQGPRAASQQKPNAFEKVIERLSSMFPHYTRPTLTEFIKEARAANGGSLNLLSYEEIINRVAQLILDHQENTREQMGSASGAKLGELGAQPHASWTSALGAMPKSSSPAPGLDPGVTPSSHPWRTMDPKNHSRWSRAGALNDEDPCIICHEEMSQQDLCVLECRHSFHRECIKAWLKEQSTCPTCRVHALLPEDFPILSGRIPQSHMHHAGSS